MITIQNNNNNRRILLLDSQFALEESPDFPEYLFDAVFIFNDSVEQTQSILNDINPVTSQKCCYKPFFVARTLEGKMGDYSDLIDGYFDDWNDKDCLNKVEDIINRRNDLGLSAAEEKILSSNQFFVRLTRFLIIRNKLILTPVLEKIHNKRWSVKKNPR